MSDAKYEYAHKHEFTTEEKQFGKDAIQVFRKIVSMYYLQSNTPSSNKIEELNLQAKTAINKFMIG